MAALSLPTPMPTPISAQASAMLALIFSAPSKPPVMAVTINGKSSFLPRTMADVSISSRSTSGRASCIRVTSSQYLYPGRISRLRHISMWSAFLFFICVIGYRLLPWCRRHSLRAGDSEAFLPRCRSPVRNLFCQSTSST
ncbi:hypothetical protein SDC9_118601 [bioreactor metagenome]|uniref:Uncharacterized protein n=1 Tax=bioreactor metagenome TaxID=1076179 RepID=A0A645C831_9ZZZZ